MRLRLRLRLLAVTLSRLAAAAAAVSCQLVAPPPSINHLRAQQELRSAREHVNRACNQWRAVLTGAHAELMLSSCRVHTAGGHTCGWVRGSSSGWVLTGRRCAVAAARSRGSRYWSIQRSIQRKSIDRVIVALPPNAVCTMWGRERCKE